MRILPDGQVELKNNDTGETKIVSPNELSTYSPRLPQLYNEYLQGQNTQASTANTQLNSDATIAKLPAITAETVVAKNKTDQLNFIKSTAQDLAKVTGGDGHVSPSDYNKAKEKAMALSIPESDFDNIMQSYVDPKNIYYNTPDGRSAQNALDTTKRQIQSLLDAYTSIPNSEKGVISRSSLNGIPVIGDSIGQMVSPEAASYEKNRIGLSAQLASIAGAGTGSGVRITQTELNNWANLLPSTRNSVAGNKKNMEQLDSLIKAKFNVGQGLDPKYLPQVRVRDKVSGQTGSIPTNEFDAKRYEKVQ